MQADLHCHSQFSDRPSEWFLKRIGTRESYTPIETVYETAKRRGMDFVTLTDHNTIDGALLLKQQHPADTFVSVEATTYFPEDGCKIHVLVYGLDEKQFAELERVRDNIYDLRAFLQSSGLSHSVAHPAYSINGKLTIDHLEKLILLFNVFEGHNGSRPARANNTWMENLEELTPEHIERLAAAHGLKPWGDTPWIKSFTAGSDDHAGLFVATTYTRAPGETVDDFVKAIGRQKSTTAGRHNDYKGLAFSLYKIAWDFYKSQSLDDGTGNDMLRDIFGLVFENKKIGARNWLSLQQLRMRKNEKNKAMSRFFDDLVESLNNRDKVSTDEQHRRIYDNVATLADDYFTMIMRGVEKDLRKGNAFKLLRNVSAALPGVFLSTPFLTTLRHMHLNRGLLDELTRRCQGELTIVGRERKVLWFTDTLHELNGVSETLKKMAWAAHTNGRPLSLAVSVPPEQLTKEVPPNVVNLPCVWSWQPEFYNSATLRFPSLLKSLEMIHEYQPDEIVISTPGPVGLMGLLAAKLLSVKSVAVYHTDFTRQAALFLADDFMTKVTETYMHWFHKLVDEIRVPTRHYIPVLGERGYDVSRMKVFKRGIELDTFKYSDEARAAIRAQHHLGSGPVLLWAGRLGKEKSLDFLSDIYQATCERYGRVKLVIAGHGPEEEYLKTRLAAFGDDVLFAGRVPHEELPAWYSAADLFVFPSVTETFGMVILEAQACGLPALVTNVGGPQELISDGETGTILKAGDREAWVCEIGRMLNLIEKQPEKYLEMRYRARSRVEKQASWFEALDDLIGRNGISGKKYKDLTVVPPVTQLSPEAV